MIQKLSKWYFTKSALPYWCILALDFVIVGFAFLVDKFFELGALGFVLSFWTSFRTALLCLLPYGLFFKIFHTYSVAVRYSSFTDLGRILLANLAACFCVMLLRVFFGEDGFFNFPGRIGLITLFCGAVLMMCAVRVMVRYLYIVLTSRGKTRKAFIYGVREGGVAIAQSIRNQLGGDYSVAGFVTPPGDMSVAYLMGVKVYDDAPGIISIMKAEGANYLFVSPLQTETFRNRQELIDDLTSAGIHILMTPQTEEWDGKSDINHVRLQEVDVEDLLPRDKIEVDMEAIGTMLKGRRVLVTGAAGSIGSELARQVAKFAPAELVLVDQAESPMHDVRLYMATNHPELPVLTIVSSITDATHMEKIFSEHNPEYVFHAAAYKHVPMMEDNPGQAVRNNIYGTRVIADLAVKYGTRKFVMISTDKAVNPTNVMGCSKRICEIYCQALNGHQTGTQFITTRFGNVLGSNGSVIPIFREQIRKGGPVKVTHPDIIRYFMLISEACRLVLEAGTMGKGGEIFVFDMGRPVKIVDLARRMIAMSGAKDVKIVFTGLRAGEKLYEELLAAAETNKPTPNPKIMVAQVREYPYELALSNEQELLALSEQFDAKAIVRKMKEIVPEYVSTNPEYAE